MVKDIHYTQHAEERLKKRSISKELIEDAINNPDESFKKNDFKIIHKFLGEKLLRVFLRKEDISKEIEDGIVVDYSKEGKVIGIEILKVSHIMDLKDLGEITVSLPTIKEEV